MSLITSKLTIYLNISLLISILFQLIFRLLRCGKLELIKNPSGKRRRIKEKPKDRQIYFASHFDAMIYSKYNSILIDAYERFIEHKPFNESIVAYRKIPIIKGNKGNRCNIDFTRTAFEYIKSNQDKKLTVIIADITKFFDNLNHKILKKKWSEILHETALPLDHYNLFKSLTKIKYVESNQLFEAYNQTVYVERGVPNSSKKRELVKKKIKGTTFFSLKN